MIDTVPYVVLQVFLMIGGDRAIDIEWQCTHYGLQVFKSLRHHLRAREIHKL